MKRIIRWISLILIVALMAQILPMGVWANEQMHEAAHVPEWNANEQEEQPYVIGEVRELRGENQKHFRMSDGSYIAVSYGDSVHFSDAEGTWQDIDNTLVASTNGREFQAVNGIERRRFASQIEEGGFLLSVESGEYGVQLSAVREDMENTLSTSQFGELTTEKQQPTAIVSNPQTSYATLAIEEKRELSLAEQTAPEKISSSVRYENVWEETDLEYSIMGQNVKECIVIHTAREAYSYSFLLRLTELTPVLNVDGSISLCNAQAESIFSIPAPYMEDANGVHSSKAAYTLEDEGDGLYLLTVTADAQWMNAEDRAFPVKLDPTIFKEGSAADKNIITSYVNSSNSNSTSYENQRFIRCGYYTNSHDTNCTGYTVGLIYIKELPDLPKGSVPTQAYLNLFQTAYGGSTNSNHPKIYASTLNTATSDETIESYLNAITWNGFLSDINYGAPDANGERTALDYVKASMQTLYENYWDITSAVQTWYNEKGSVNPSISKLLVLDDGHNTPSNSRATYAGYGYDASNALHLPQIIVAYRNTVGTEGIYDYHTQSVGRAGVGYVNNFTLGLSFQVPVVSVPSEVLPFSLSLIYNSAHGATHFTAAEDIHTKSYTTSQAGRGWKTSVQQSVVSVNITGNDSSTQKYLVYTDADGTEHYFAKKSGSSTVYEDEDGLGLTITASSSATNPTYYTMKDKNQNTWVFYYGYLTSFTDYNGNSLYYAYNGVDYNTSNTTWRPSNSTGPYQVTSVWRKNDGATSAEKLVELKYSQTVSDANGTEYAYLTGIVDHAGRTTTITVGYNLLQSITFPDGKTATYTYETANNQKLLTSATDNEMLYRIDYTYFYQLGEMRVFTIQESAKDGDDWLTGDTMRAFKQNAVYTRFRYYGADCLPQTEDDTGTRAKDDLVSRFWFDNWGRTVNVTTLNGDETEILNVSASNYTKNEGTDKKNNRLLGAACSGALSPNLLYNSGAEHETNLDGWTATENGSSAAREDSGSDVLVTPRTGGYLMKLYQQNTGLGTHSRYQSVYLSAGTTYVFSAYVNTACTTSFGTSGGAYLSVRNSGGTEQKTSRLVNYKTNTAIDGGWERLELVYTPSSSGLYQFAANIKNMAEIAVFDDLQLEAIVNTVEGGQTDGAPSTVDLLQLGSFETPYTAENTINRDQIRAWWTYEADKAAPVSYTGRGYAMTFAPGITAKHRATQVVPLNVPSNTTFLLSAWGLTPASVMNTEEDLTEVNSGNKRFFGIIATVTYADEDGSKEYFYIPFNDDVSDWQYVCGTIVPSQENKTVASITVDLACDYNANRTYMDEVRLVMEPVQTYAYDDDGNLLNTSDSENNKTSTEYDDSDRLIKYTGMDGVSYALTYSGTNRDPATITSDGVTTQYTYDDAGNITLTKVTNTTDSRFLQSSATYSTDGNRTESVINTSGATTSYSYYVEGNLSDNQKALDLLKTVTNAKGTVTEYTYNDLNDRSNTVTVDGNHIIAYEYERGRLVGLNRNHITTSDNTEVWSWQRYRTYYNAFGQTVKITVSQASDANHAPSPAVGTELTLAEYTYAPNGGNLQKMTYGNGDFVKYTYDLLDRVIEEVYYNSSGSKARSVTFVYDARGQLAKRYTKNASDTDTVTETHIFEYDSLGRLIRSSEFDGANNLIQRIEQLYDKANRLEKQSWVIDGDSYSESYTYDTTDGMLASAQTATGDKILYTYDSLKRLGGTAVENAAGDPLFRTGYSYKAGAETNQTTDQVLVYTTWDPNYSNILSYRYRYDALGNITKIEDVTNAARTLAEYTYDELNQLTQEKIYNYNSNGTYINTDVYDYTYDTAGNLLKEEKNQAIVNTYSYSTGPWADQLVAVNGEEITYDGSGNPEIYVSGYGIIYGMCEFEGRNWVGFQTWSGPPLQVAYDYDADGIRTHKNVDGEDHIYVTQNGKVVRETIGTGTTAKVLDFVYDNSGKPFALTYTDGTAEPQRYYYVLNLQGDVVALMTADRTIVARYTYNAWGKLLSVTDEDGNAITSASHIANLNPIRYRGYYYDTETGFYYLQSRYYDPANHRFINADCYTSTGQGFLGCNMFAYCLNSPVVYKDSFGAAVETVFDAVSALASLVQLFVAPSWANLGYLLWDIAALLVPVVPGSYVSKGGKLVVKVASKIDDFLDGSKFLTGTYKQLKKLFNGIKGIEIHHIIEKRFHWLFDIHPKDFLSIPLTSELHQIITNRWRNLHKISDTFRLFAYGSNYSEITYEMMELAIYTVYGDMPQVLNEALEWLSKHWKELR